MSMTRGLKRRDLLRLAAWSSIVASMPRPFTVHAATGDNAGPLIVTLQVSGGWDVSSFCDPKANVPGEKVINTWANTGEIQQVGNLSYAPFAGNATFFEKYYQHMLVINGVDAQTNSHSAGVTHNWSGRLSEGYPTATALAASVFGADLPMGYVSGGGYQETARLVRYTSLSNPEGLAGLINGNVTLWDAEQQYRHQSDLDRIKRYQLEQLEELLGSSTLTPRQRHAMETYYQARVARTELGAFAELLPTGDELQPSVEVTGDVQSTVHRQAQVALIGFQSGVSMAADLFLRGFDTHADHDQDHEPMLAHLTDAVDYIWETAESLGLADRLLVFISSDFARTPRYNSSEGKDHWPIGSAIFMAKNAPWGNRVVGGSDELQNALNISPATLLHDDVSGRHIYPGDVQRTLRVLTGVDQHESALRFPINTGDYMDFLT